MQVDEKEEIVSEKSVNDKDIVRAKLRLVLLPFMMVSTCFIFLYTLLHWFFSIHLEIISIDEEMLCVWLPSALSLLFTLIWIYPRIRLLQLKHPGVYFGIATVILAIPTVIAQFYLISATGQLTELPNIASIQDHGKTKFYKVNAYYVSKEDFGYHLNQYLSGKYHEKLDTWLYLALPIYDSSQHERNTFPAAWLGVRYHESIKASLSAGEKQERLEKFVERSLEDLSSKDVQQFVYLNRIGVSNDLGGYQKALENSPKFNSNNSVILTSVNTPFESRDKGMHVWIVLAYCLGDLVWLIMILNPKFNEEALIHFLRKNVAKEKIEQEVSSEEQAVSFEGQEVSSEEQAVSSDEDDWLDILKMMLIPSRDLFAVPLLIDLNLIVFLAMIFLGYGTHAFSDSDLLINWGASYRPAVEAGEYWRLFTSLFVHGGFYHFIVNMASLFFLGIGLEMIFGARKLLLAYLIVGVSSSLASVYWYEASVSVGASGAIFGLSGMLIAWHCLIKYFYGWEVADVGEVFIKWAALILASGIGMAFIMDGIDNAAHFGGFVSGLVIGGVFALQTNISMRELTS